MHLLFSLFIHLAACIPLAAPSIVTSKDRLFAVMDFDYHSILAIFVLFYILPLFCVVNGVTPLSYLNLVFA